MHKLHESFSPEASSLGDGKYRIRIIVPGQGSSGIYTAENLAESAPLFKAGTEMFIDHPTEPRSGRARSVLFVIMLVSSWRMPLSEKMVHSIRCAKSFRV